MLHGQAASSRVFIRHGYLEAVLGCVGLDYYGLIENRVLLMFRGHSDVLGGRDQADG
jgi:hypothetical protein